MIGIITLTAGGGTVDLNDYAPATRFLITTAAPVTLLANWVIQNTVPASTTSYEFIIDADIDLNGSTITVLGEAMPQEIFDGLSKLSAYYNGATYDNVSTVNYTGSDWVVTSKIKNNAVTTDKIVNDAITTAKILDDQVTADKFGTSEKIEVFMLPVSWETGEIGAGYRIYIPFACVLLGASTTISTALAITDPGTITFTTSTGTPTPSAPISFAAASPIGTGQLVTFSGAPATIAADGFILATTAKATPGGKGMSTVWVRRGT